MQLIDVDDADFERVDGAVVVERAAVGLRDVEPLIVERLGKLRQNARLVGTHDLHRRWPCCFVVQIPLDFDPSFFGLFHRRRTGLGVDGDAATARDHADDWIASDGGTALAKAHQNIVFPGDANPWRLETGRSLGQIRGFRRGFRGGAHRALAFGKKLFDDIGGKQLAVPDVHQHFVDALLSQFVYRMNQIAGSFTFGKRHVVLTQLSIEQIPPERLRFFTLLAAHEVADFRFRRRRFDKLEPVFGRFLVRTGDDFDGVAVA